MGLHHQTMVSPAHKAVGGDHTAPAAPPTPLHVLSSQAASVSAPATPVMVYTYPHGYMMAYTQARTPQQPTVSQVITLEPSRTRITYCLASFQELGSEIGDVSWFTG